MADIRGQLRATGRIAIFVSQYNERVTSRLLDGALECCRAANIAETDVDLYSVSSDVNLSTTEAV